MFLECHRVVFQFSNITCVKNDDIGGEICLKSLKILRYFMTEECYNYKLCGSLESYNLGKLFLFTHSIICKCFDVVHNASKPTCHTDENNRDSKNIMPLSIDTASH